MKDAKREKSILSACAWFWWWDPDLHTYKSFKINLQILWDDWVVKSACHEACGLSLILGQVAEAEN